jgi:SAM-dependent methyltransferase
MSLNLQKVCEQIEVGLGDEISPFELDFMRRVYGSDVSVYRDRLLAVDMLDQPRILDAGCGFGQWMLAMSNGENEVHGMDSSPLCVKASSIALQAAGVPKSKVFQGHFDAIDAPDDYYDAVFAYSSMFLSPWKQSFAEVVRVLKPGGHFYFSANELGFYAMLWMEEHNKVEGHYDPRAHAARALENTLYYEKHGEFKYEGFVHVIITREQARTELERLGMSIVAVGDEGTLSLRPDDVAPTAFFKGEYYGLPGCYEAVAVKK